MVLTVLNPHPQPFSQKEKGDRCHLMRIVFMGTPESAVPSLRRLLEDSHEVLAVWTQPDKPAGRGKKLHESPVKQFALQHNLTVHQPAKIKHDEAKKLFASHNADAAVVVAYGKILPLEFLDAPKHGCLNVHFSLLPKYRGAAPVNWAIVNGEAETGVTTMQIVEQLDAGPVLLQKATKIGSPETAPELMNRLADLGAHLISETLSHIDEIEPKPQPHAEATFAPILKREDGIVDSSTRTASIDDRIRGFQPWPSAYTMFRSRRLIIGQATGEPLDENQFEAGEVIAAGGDTLKIACGNASALKLHEVQPEGGRRLNTRDFLNGSHVSVGERFGLVDWC